MSEILTIRNFGPIKDMTLDLRHVNVLIGEQGTGKSTVVKIIAICRYFSFITNFDYFEKEGSAFSWGLIEWGLAEYVNNNTYIYYSCDDYELEGNAKRPTSTYHPFVDDQTNESIFDIEIKLTSKSEPFKKLIEELKELNNGSEQFSLSDTPVSFFQNSVSQVMKKPFYLTEARGLQSLFSLGKNSIQNLSDALFQQLAELYEVNSRFKNETAIEPLAIYYKNVDGRGYLRKINNEKYFSLSNAAAGYKTAIPTILAIKHFSTIKKKKKTFIIEEPELSLFPNAQQASVNYFVQHFNEQGHEFYLTTHSPYILTSLNNLMYAFEVGKKEPEKVNEIIDKKYWLNPQDLSAYKLLADGTCENIIESDENGTLIKAEKIDEISIRLNNEFDKLIKLEILNMNEE